MRWLEDDGRVTVFRSPSNNSNGNTFDSQGRQLSCEHVDAPRRPLRARRLGHGDRRGVPGQAAELAERRRRRTGRQHLVHRSAVRRAAVRGRARRERRADERAAVQPEAGQPRSRRVQARAADQRLSRRSGRPRRHGDRRGAGAGSERPRRSRRTTRSCTSRARARARATPAPAARARSTCSTSAPTTSVSNRQAVHATA